MTQKLTPLYETIRTSNLLPDRSADVHFDPDLEPSMTLQSSLAECDINTIVAQNERTGLLTHVNRAIPHFGDFGTSVDFHTAQNYLTEANNAFMGLPAELRAKFENNPGKLLDYVSDPANIEEAVQLGLATYLKPEERYDPHTDPKNMPKTPLKQAEE